MSAPYVILTDLQTSTQLNSFYSYGLILSAQNIGLPPVKSNYISIEGMNGSLDMSEVFGEVLYNDRTLTFTFNIVNNTYAWDELRTKIANDIHGKRFKIEIYSDPNYYYIGRCLIDKYQSSRALGTIVLKCTCEPYKYGQEFYSVYTLGSGTNATVNSEFSVGGAAVKILCDALGATSDVKFKIDNGTTYTVAKGQTAYYPTLIGSGSHTIQVIGQGTAAIRFTNRSI